MVLNWFLQASINREKAWKEYLLAVERGVLNIGFSIERIKAILEFLGIPYKLITPDVAGAIYRVVKGEESADQGGVVSGIYEIYKNLGDVILLGHREEFEKSLECLVKDPYSAHDEWVVRSVLIEILLEYFIVVLKISGVLGEKEIIYDILWDEEIKRYGWLLHLLIKSHSELRELAYYDGIEKRPVMYVMSRKGVSVLRRFLRMQEREPRRFYEVMGKIEEPKNIKKLEKKLLKKLSNFEEALRRYDESAAKRLNAAEVIIDKDIVRVMERFEFPYVPVSRAKAEVMLRVFRGEVNRSEESEVALYRVLKYGRRNVRFFGLERNLKSYIKKGDEESEFRIRCDMNFLFLRIIANERERKLMKKFEIYRSGQKILALHFLLREKYTGVTVYRGKASFGEEVIKKVPLVSKVSKGRLGYWITLREEDPEEYFRMVEVEYQSYRKEHPLSFNAVLKFKKEISKSAS